MSELRDMAAMAARRRERDAVMARVVEASARHRQSIDTLERVAENRRRDTAAGRPPDLMVTTPRDDSMMFAERAERVEMLRLEHLARRARADREVASAERLAQSARRAWPA